MGKSLPYRSSHCSIPRLKSPSDKRKKVYYEYGNEYNPKTGKSSIYVDIVNGNADLVDYVGFRFWPSGETHNIRKRSTVKLSDGNIARRFIVKPFMVENWSRKITIVVFGKGGSRRVRRLGSKRQHFRERPLAFLETRPLRSSYVQMPSFRFGIELEASLGSRTTSEEVVRTIRERASVRVLDKTENYRRGKEDDYSFWQLVPDASTTCSPSNPDCNKFELVSRILCGESGLAECRKVIEALHSVGKVSINQSMGFHVHVNARDMSLEQIKNICLNFIKHESAMDSILPRSRESSDYCRSNRDAMLHQDSIGLKHRAIASCKNLASLCDLVNPGEEGSARYYKLNLQNLHPGRKQRKQEKSTIEFRQHSGTADFEKIEAWVRFCVAFCNNSKERPSKLRPIEDAFESLFDTVIQDVKLKAFYTERRNNFMNECRTDHIQAGGGGACCAPCAKGGGS